MLKQKCRAVSSPTAPTLPSRTASALVRSHAQVALRWHDTLTRVAELKFPVKLCAELEVISASCVQSTFKAER